jgi:hypothetical protein
MQLQIALALSREECEKEQELRRGDDIRLQVNWNYNSGKRKYEKQIAIEESKRAMAARSSSLGSGLDASQKPSTSKSQVTIAIIFSSCLGVNKGYSLLGSHRRLAFPGSGRNLQSTAKCAKHVRPVYLCPGVQRPK